MRTNIRIRKDKPQEEIVGYRIVLNKQVYEGDWAGGHSTPNLAPLPKSKENIILDDNIKNIRQANKLFKLYLSNMETFTQNGQSMVLISTIRLYAIIKREGDNEYTYRYVKRQKNNKIKEEICN